LAGSSEMKRKDYHNFPQDLICEHVGCQASMKTIILRLPWSCYSKRIFQCLCSIPNVKVKGYWRDSFTNNTVCSSHFFLKRQRKRKIHFSSRLFYAPYFDRPRLKWMQTIATVVQYFFHSNFFNS
jgi:hypothetical protein